MILVDTSVWIDHLRAAVPALSEALDQNRVLMHPYVLGELACGNLSNRGQLLDLLSRLPVPPVATQAEALSLIDQWSLMGQGIGYLDVHLLASVALAGEARLWTRDRRLAAVAVDRHLAFVEET